MDELVGRIVSNVQIDRSVAEKAVGIILDFLLNEGPTDKVQILVDRLPGAQAAVEVARSQSGGGLFGGMGGLMGVGSRLMAAGLGMSEIQGVTREIVSYSRENLGDDAAAEIVAAIPGLGQFI